ncbi:MAG: Arm DNA-binding domain-containing protein [Cyclobacteriaceae bacterium]
MNFSQTVSILFWLNRSKVNNKSLVPIWVRITEDGKRAECSIQKQILPGLWAAKHNKAKGNSPEARSINHYLVMVQVETTKHYSILSTKDVDTVEDVKNSYRGTKEV